MRWLPAIVSLALALACAADGSPGDAETGAGDGATTGTPPPPTSSSGLATTAAATTTDSTASTGPTVDCELDGDCRGRAEQWCLQGRCVTCEDMADPDAACEGAVQARPVCVDGLCVQCDVDKADLCTDTTPVCDPATFTCAACTDHPQCPAGCDKVSGACIETAYWVDTLVVCPGSGTELDPFCDLADAESQVPPDGSAVVWLAASRNFSNVLLHVDAGRTIALLKEPGDATRLSGGTSIIPMLQATSGGTLIIEDLELDTSAVPVRASDASAWVERTVFRGGFNVRVAARQEALLHIRNSFIGPARFTPTIEVEGATAELLSSTLIASADEAALDPEPAVLCDAPSEVRIRNSVVFTIRAGATFDCPNVSATRSVTEALLPGAGNVAVGEMVVDDFLLWFVNPGAQDYHLNVPHIAIRTAARWQPGDPLTDIDGDPRPGIPDAEDFAGADVIPP